MVGTLGEIQEVSAPPAIGPTPQHAFSARQHTRERLRLFRSARRCKIRHRAETRRNVTGLIILGLFGLLVWASAVRQRGEVDFQ